MNNAPLRRLLTDDSRSPRTNGHSQFPAEAHSQPVGQNGTPPPARSIYELQRRANEARVRFLNTEIEMATSLLSRTVDAHDPREREKFLREARETLQLAERVAHADPDSHSQEISQQLTQLNNRLDQLSATYRDASPR